MEQEEDSRVRESLGYVLGSRQRERVLAAVIHTPRTPGDVARDTGLQLPHVSRALAQLRQAGLVTGLSDQRFGRLYEASALGRSLFTAVAEARGDRVAPMVRGTHLRIYRDWITRSFGREAAEGIFREAGLDATRIDPDGWYLLRPCLRILELVEKRFGDGSYRIVRQMFQDGVASVPSIQRLLRRVLPLRMLVEMAPGVYTREFNHGRLEVEVQEKSAVFKHYDWLSSPARCAAWLGTYEGVTLVKGLEPQVRKVACMLKGDRYCGYLVEW